MKSRWIKWAWDIARMRGSAMPKDFGGKARGSNLEDLDIAGWIIL
jgi:hypothetical protein